MSLSGFAIEKAQVSQRIKRVLGQIQETLKVSHEEWLSVLEITPKEHRLLLESTASVPMQLVLRVADRFDLSMDSILRNQIDFGILAERYHGNIHSIPSRYLPHAYSRVHTADVIFDFLERTYGSFHSTAIERYLQIGRKELVQSNQPVNFLIYLDIFDYLRRSYHPNVGFYRKMGGHSTRVNQRSELGTLFGSMESVKQVYERMLGDLMVLYEKNSRYQIMKLDSQSCLVQCHQYDDLASALNVPFLGNRHVCEWKKGVFSSLPAYLGKSHSVVRELKCVHRGDSYCLFEFNYGHLQNRGPKYNS